MGMFKQMKDMKQMVQAAPGLVQAAQEAGAEAQRLAASMQAQQAATAAAPAGTITTAEMAPIAGVSLELYAEVSRGLAAYGYDTSKAADVAARHGVAARDWDAAVEGWNARMAANPAVAREFNRLYTGR